jgi:hypothetical protein
MKKYRNKMMISEGVSESTTKEFIFICVQECNVPGVGTWKSGDKITNPEIIEKISGSPCFKKIQEVE